VTVDDLYLPVFRYTGTAAAVDFIQQSVQTCSAEIPVAVAESEIRVADFLHVAPLCVINLMRLGFACLEQKGGV